MAGWRGRGGARSPQRRPTIDPAPPLDPPAADPSSDAAGPALVALVAQLAASAEALDADGALPTREIGLLAEAGLLAAPVPRAGGGRGLGTEAGATAALLDVLAAIGRGNLSIGRIYEGHVNALQLVLTYGTPDQAARAAAESRDRATLFGVWNTEGPDGVLLHALGGGRYRLSGAKTFGSGAGVVGRALVTGRLPGGGWQMCLVPMDRVAAEIDPSWWRPIGMRGSASFKVGFDGVVVGPDDLIGRPDDYYRQPWFGGGAIRFAAVQLGGAEALADAARAEVRALGRDGDPHQRARFGQLAAAVEAGRLWLGSAASRLDRAHAPDAPEAERIVAYANMTRSAIEAICLDAIRLVERSVGARGLLRPHAIERTIRDLTLYLRQPAPDAAVEDVGRYVLASPAPSPEVWRAPLPGAP